MATARLINAIQNNQLETVLDLLQVQHASRHQIMHETAYKLLAEKLHHLIRLKDYGFNLKLLVSGRLTNPESNLLEYCQHYLPELFITSEESSPCSGLSNN